MFSCHSLMLLFFKKGIGREEREKEKERARKRERKKEKEEERSDIEY